MRKRIFKKVLILSSVLGLTPFLANAGWFIDAIGKGAIFFVVQVIAYILGWIASGVFYIGGKLIDFALSINLALLNNPFIKTGWNIVLNFTNLGFVLAIIVIAFATILGLQSYGIKKSLWKLIVAALLVNFSLAIAGFFIEISDSVTVFFNSKIQGASKTGLSTRLAGIINPQFMLSGKDFKQAQSQVMGNASQQNTSPTAQQKTSPTIPSEQQSLYGL